MAVLKTLDYDISLSRLWDELVYTEARLLKNKVTVDLAAVFTELIDRAESVELRQRKVWRAEIQADASVDNADDELDDTCDTIFVEFRYLDAGARKGRARLTRYVGNDAPNAILRMGLASEIERVRTWPASLKSEPEEKLQALGALLESNLSTGNQSLAERTEASGARANQRAREIMPLIDDVNSARKSTFGRLVSRAEKHKLSDGWPRRFFRRSSVSSKTVKVTRDDPTDDTARNP